MPEEKHTGEQSLHSRPQCQIIKRLGCECIPKCKCAAAEQSGKDNERERVPHRLEANARVPSYGFRLGGNSHVGEGSGHLATKDANSSILFISAQRHVTNHELSLVYNVIPT